MEAKIKELEALLKKAAELSAQISNEAKERAEKARQERIIALKREARANGEELADEVDERLFNEKLHNEGIAYDAERLQEHIEWSLKKEKMFK